MAGLLRKYQALFGGSLAPASNVSAWGSLAAGAVDYTNDPAAIQTAAWLDGFAPALIGNKSPTFQDLNGAFLTITYQLQYLLSRGLPEYDPSGDTTYNTNDVCRVGKNYYISLIDGNVGNPPPSAQWANLFAELQGPSLALAWVLFNGQGALGALTVYNAFNVSGVTKMATGSYNVAFTNPLPSDNYGFSGSAGVANGQVADGGSNNFICGAPNGAIGIHNQNNCQVCCREPSQSGLEDNGYIFAVFHGS